jgi:hypothetical protein
MAHEWIVERTTQERLPFRIRIEGPGATILAVRARSVWPGAGSQVFCLRETEPPSAGETLELVERAPVAHLARLGRKLSVTLDRPTRKRCEFLKVEVKNAGGDVVREQLFFRTQTAAREHRSSGRVEVWPAETYHVLVDAAERYPWRFPGATCSRRRLPVGDYALLDGEKIVALVERKALDNILADVTRLRPLHQQLTELSTYEHAALVVEAQYDDFSDPRRVRAWQPAHLLRVLAELQALHPRLPIVYAGSRRSANVWVQRFFAAVAGKSAQPAMGLAETALPLFADATSVGGLDIRIRELVLASETGLTITELGLQFPSAPPDRLRRVLHALRSEGKLACRGRGRTARWCRATP